MARRNPTLDAASQPDDATQALMNAGGELVEAGSELFEQWLQAQMALASSWLEWQAQWLQAYQQQGFQLPPWLIWHNGTEQLA